MSKESIMLLKELTDAPGVSGYEREVSAIMEKHLKSYAKVTRDRIGSIIFEKKGTGNGPKIMIPGHMDEIGFMVRFVTEEGFIKFLPLGGWYDQVILSQRVIIKTSKGDITGVVGSKPPHLLTPEERAKVLEKKDMFIDIGASSKKEAEEDYGVMPGDAIIPDSPFTQMKNKKLLMAKAFDDRMGCALVVEIIKALKNIKHPNTVYGVGTVQEEVGIRGAKTSAFAVDPDVCLVAEVGIANDVPGTSPEQITGKLGKGPGISILDNSMIPNVKLRELALSVAKKNKIPVQLFSLTGGTDGGAVHLNARGVPSLYIGLPTRYIHTHVGIINIDDYENTLKLMLELVKVLDAKTVQGLTE
ncbi:MAG: peptidase M28 [Candidatus Firestonebacteria bacterium RIFOXYA2_FULL_40_8]|nr:MAG: peptidase M28 [Candidatus Firestonebacteria bacterium RIFOXYA2_FULL_40_8]